MKRLLGIFLIISSLITFLANASNAQLPPPANPKADPEPGEIRLSWDEVDGAAGYRVYWDLESHKDDHAYSYFEDVIGVTSYIISKLTNGATYYLAVRAFETPGPPPSDFGDWSVEVSATPLELPDAPKNLNAYKGNKRLTITWDEVDGAAGYEAFWDVDSGTSPEDYTWSADVEEKTTYTITKLQNNMTYYIRVRAYNANEDPGPLSNEVSETPEINEAVLRVTDVKVEGLIDYEDLVMEGYDQTSDGAADTEGDDWATISFYLETETPFSGTLSVRYETEDGDVACDWKLVKVETGNYTYFWTGRWEDERDVKHNGLYVVVLEGSNEPLEDDPDLPGDQSKKASEIKETLGSVFVDVMHIQGDVRFCWTTQGDDPPVDILPYETTYRTTRDAYVTIRIYEWEDSDGDGHGEPGEVVATIIEDAPRYGETDRWDKTNTDYWDGRATCEFTIRGQEVSPGQLVPNGMYLMTILAKEFYVPFGSIWGQDFPPVRSEGDTPPTTDWVLKDIVVPIDTLRISDYKCSSLLGTEGEAGITFALSHNACVFVNIFKPGTDFVMTSDGVYDLADEGTQEATIYGKNNPIPIQGEEALVRRLTFYREAGSQTITWDGKDKDGVAVESGVYKVTIQACDSDGAVWAFEEDVNDINMVASVLVDRGEVTALPAPQNVKASRGDRKITITWDTVSGASGYRIYYDTDQSGPPYNGTGAAEGDSPVDAEGSDTKSKDLTGLVNGTTYYIAVTAYDARGFESGYSEEVSATPGAGPGPPPPPGGLKAEPGDRKITVKWNVVPDATGYYIYWDTAPGGPYANWKDAGNVTEYTIKGLENGVTYYIAVKSYNEQGESEEFSEEISTTPSAEVKFDKETVFCWPNPAKGTESVTLSWPTSGLSGSMKIEIFTCLGDLICDFSPKASQGSQVISTSGLGSGIYLIRIKAEGERQVIKKLVYIR